MKKLIFAAVTASFMASGFVGYSSAKARVAEGEPPPMDDFRGGATNYAEMPSDTFGSADMSETHMDADLSSKRFWDYYKMGTEVVGWLRKGIKDGTLFRAAVDELVHEKERPTFDNMTAQLTSNPIMSVVFIGSTFFDPTVSKALAAEFKNMGYPERVVDGALEASQAVWKYWRFFQSPAEKEALARARFPSDGVGGF